VPESASLAPSNAIAYVTLVTDDASQQWRNADRLLGLIPDVRDAAVDELESSLAEEGLTWSEDVAPAVGPEMVVVATADKRAVVLVRPSDEAKLDELLAKADEPAATASVSGWTALAETQAELDAYRKALSAGTLATRESFEEAMEALPEDALARAWVDMSALTDEIEGFLEEEGAGRDIDPGVEALSIAFSAEEDGVLVTASVYGPEGGTSYEPEAFRSIPADAVVAMSFGGTQELVDRFQDSVDLNDVEAQVEDVTGVSLDSLLDALTGEGALYVREGGSVPEVTLVLAPPDAEEAFRSVDRAIRGVARESGIPVETVQENGIDTTRMASDELAVEYAFLDGETVIVTTGTQGIADFTGEGPKLADSESFQRAAERVGIEDRTSGFVYIDLDGLIPFVEDLSGEVVPPDVRRAVGKLDSFALEISGEGTTNTVEGFVRVNAP
jgi:hypothetical protein